MGRVCMHTPGRCFVSAVKSGLFSCKGMEYFSYFCTNFSTGMSEKENFYTKYLSKLNLYVVVIAVFMIITFAVGDSNLYVRYTYDDKIRSLEREIKHYRKEIETNRRKLEDLHTSKERLEQYAREEFYMKRKNEDIFIIRD